MMLPKRKSFYYRWWFGAIELWVSIFHHFSVQEGSQGIYCTQHIYIYMVFISTYNMREYKYVSIYARISHY